jgi:hypothetical protein
VRQTVADYAAYLGVKVADAPVCRGHADPLTFLTAWAFDRPAVSLVLGPRGGGKSYLSALATHLDSSQYDQHGTRILGGSLSQSAQIYEALREFDGRLGHRSPVRAITATRATYLTGSDVSILAASPTSVRGPHVPTLRLDEVDEIDDDIRDASLGMCMERRGVPAMVSMTSTWHRLGGPMSKLMERGQAGEFPCYEFCAFEVLERCPEERSGPNLERCPECPLVQWCHADLGETGRPKAKRSNGHYAIESLIQKVRTVSLRVFLADYLCQGPKADGVWFTRFDAQQHVTEAAEYDPHLPVHVAVDGGVTTGAVLFQVREAGGGHHVNVFGDHLEEGVTAFTNARAIVALPSLEGRQLVRQSLEADRLARRLVVVLPPSQGPIPHVPPGTGKPVQERLLSPGRLHAEAVRPCDRRARVNPSWFVRRCTKAPGRAWPR